MELTDRVSECGALDRLIETVRAGESRALVVRGDPGVGKTVLLEYCRLYLISQHPFRRAVPHSKVRCSARHSDEHLRVDQNAGTRSGRGET
jgi:hypothetical protein